VAAAAEAYVRRTMYREQVTLWRRRRLTELPVSEIPEQHRPGAADDTAEDRMVLRDALMTLGRRQRTVLVLRYFEDLTEQQVADALGVSLGTVKSTAHKALTRLRELCGEHAPATGGEVA
jgi:RNA polymerase sigma factor (sigma-70 family)